MARLFSVILAIAICLSSGCIPFVSSPNRNFVLAEAASKGDVAGVEKALKNGADVNSRPTMSDDSRAGDPTILMIVAQQTTNDESMRLDVVKHLLEQGANPWLTDTQGKTALDYAIRCNAKIASFLWKYMLDHPKSNYQVP